MSDEVPTVIVTPVPAPPKPVDASKPPVLGALVGLLSSQKALVMGALTIGTLVLVGLGRVTWDQCKDFLQVLIPAWLASHAVQDGLSAFAKPKPAVQP